MGNEQWLGTFTRAYIEAALFSTNDQSDEQGGEPLDKNYNEDDIAPETMALIEADCADFVKRYGRLIDADDSPAIQKWGRWSLAGHDFWLTREGHGAGFWDGDWPKHGDELTEASKTYGGFDLYVGDDGLIYGPPADWYKGRHARKLPSGVTEAVPRPHRVHGRYRKPPRLPPHGHLVLPRASVVRDFSSIDELIDHARGDGATHVLPLGKQTVLFYPTGRYWPNGEPQYEAGKVWQQGGYWHSVAPAKRTPLTSGLPGGAQTIEAYLARGGGSHRSRTVRDYAAVDTRGRRVAGPFKDYGAAKREADRVRGHVEFVAGEGRRVRDYVPVDSHDRPLARPSKDYSEAKRQADRAGGYVKFTQPAMREAARRGRRADASAIAIATELSRRVKGGTPRTISGGFRWSERNEAAQFTTYSPEYQQKVVVVVGLFEDGSTAITIFSNESLSEIDRYENISTFTYKKVDTRSMVEDVQWVFKTIDGYAASWQSDTEMDETRRPRGRRSAHHRMTRAPVRRRAGRR